MTREEQLKKTDRKCPKCKSKRLLFIELWKGHNIVWEQDPDTGMIEINEGILNPGDPYKVESQCIDCRHKWNTNKSQIYQLVKD